MVFQHQTGESVCSRKQWTCLAFSRDDWNHQGISSRSSVEMTRSRITSSRSRIPSMFSNGTFVSSNRCTLKLTSNSPSSTEDRFSWKWVWESVSMCFWMRFCLTKKFNGFDIERIFNELSTIQRDVQALINNNQWLVDIIRQIDRTNLSLTEIYQQFNNFIRYLPEFEQFQSE